VRSLKKEKYKATFARWTFKVLNNHSHTPSTPTTREVVVFQLRIKLTN